MIIKKILFTISNDLALTGLLALAYYLIRILPYNALSIIIEFVLLLLLFLFYWLRIVTVTGDVYDDEYDFLYFIFLKMIFFIINAIAVALIDAFAPPLIVMILFGVNTILVSGRQYYRIILLMRSKYEKSDGYVLSAKRKLVWHSGSGRGFFAVYHVAEFGFEDGGSVFITVDLYTYLRIKRNKKVSLIRYPLHKDGQFLELVVRK